MRTLDRRTFVSLTSLGLSAVAVGCTGGTHGSDGGRSTSTAGGAQADAKLDAGARDAGARDAGAEDGGGTGSDPDAGEDAVADAGEGGLEPTCGELTEDNIEGPFFTADSPERVDFTEPDRPGTVLRLSGRVVDVNCQPLAGVLVDFWHADPDGAYDNLGYRFRGHQFTDVEGRYELVTLMPGRYLNGASFRPAHLHVKLRTGCSLLTTQLYFEDDPYNADDPYIHSSLIMPLTDQGEAKAAHFEFVLPGCSS